MDTDGKTLTLNQCDEKQQSQKWTWKEIHY
jgi:hypothetical protein